MMMGHHKTTMAGTQDHGRRDMSNRDILMIERHGYPRRKTFRYLRKV